MFVKLQVKSVEFHPVSEGARVGIGRPYTVTFEDGSTKSFVQTWDDPAPKPGAVMTLIAPVAGSAA
jgi:hypothetical protein